MTTGTCNFRAAATTIFDDHQTDVYTRIWYYATVANKIVSHHIRTNPRTKSVQTTSTLPSFRFFGVKEIDEELSAFVNQKVSIDTSVDPAVLFQYRKYIKPLLTAYVNASEEERTYVIVTAGSESGPDTTTMSRFTVGTHEVSAKKNKTRRVYITKTVGDEPDHSDNMGAFGDYFRHIMREGSPPTDIRSISDGDISDDTPDMSILLNNQTPQSTEYATFMHDMLLTFLHDSHSLRKWMKT
jgi:hypothetical protein